MIAVIVISLLLLVGGAAAGGFFFWRKRKQRLEYGATRQDKVKIIPADMQPDSMMPEPEQLDDVGDDIGDVEAPNPLNGPDRTAEDGA